MSYQYDMYLRDHREAVEKAATWMKHHLRVIIELPSYELYAFSENILRHDKSKESVYEYGPYDAYFYGEEYEKDEAAFYLAWLHHIHCNRHHWQHWLLINDDGKYREPGKVVPLEMPEIYALEMIADWWSFSWRSGNLTEIFDWYDEHKDNIILHENTRNYVEGVLDEIRHCLQG